MDALIAGFFTGLSLIIAIGAQNAFVLQQGLKRNFAMTIALTCSFIDSVLILAGSLGLGFIISRFPAIETFALYFGIVFLIYYGCRSLMNAFTPQSLKAKGTTITSYTQAIITTAAFSLLNPHVYLDTVILIGSISTAYEDQAKWFFTIGACLASWLWFYSLAIGAKKLARFFESERSWQILDTFIAIIMWLIAWKLFSMT